MDRLPAQVGRTLSSLTGRHPPLGADQHLTPHMAGHTSETKFPEQESDSNTCCSAIFYLLQTLLLIPRQTGSGVDLKQTPKDLQLRVLTVRRKTNKQKGHPHQNPSVHHHHQRPKADKTTKMGKKQCRKAEN